MEDAAEALDSKYKNKQCGGFGDFGILSFKNNKIVTFLSGGALICKNQKEKAIFLVSNAKEKELFYHHLEVGYNYIMNTI
jgi:dTDP-4-amino-4,6-dideoxygalactose transaminase